ncbi:MAG TPA: hypothetical protein VHE35_36295, partial [Kofleriaceae bacterium]|nr:hypothetical protein [Kofleriaceae bacterium]
MLDPAARTAGAPPAAGAAPAATVFVLSPARCGGERAAQLVRSRESELGRLLREDGAPLGDVFAWLSALYFRGKLTYARRFATPPPGRPGTLVMAPGHGLRAPETRLSAALLAAMGQVDVESAAFVGPLRRDADLLERACGPDTRVVLLGSIATGKYLDTLLAVFGERLLFPADFVGRGDMSRGGLMLRCVMAGLELEYTPIKGAVRHGER